MGIHDALGDRMKENYENRQRFYLVRRTPVIMRLDGRAFHTLTRKHCEKPFCNTFQESMVHGAKQCLKMISGARCAYVQSDEVSILISDFDKLTTDAWFDYNVQKMVSVSASRMALSFSRRFGQEGEFDCRVFNIPLAEVTNYFVYRQKDWLRNSIIMCSLSVFSPKQLHKKRQTDMHDMLHGVGKNWATDLDSKWKNGVFIVKKESEWVETGDVVFTQDRDAIETLLIPTED